MSPIIQYYFPKRRILLLLSIDIFLLPLSSWQRLEHKRMAMAFYFLALLRAGVFHFFGRFELRMNLL